MAEPTPQPPPEAESVLPKLTAARASLPKAPAEPGKKAPQERVVTVRKLLRGASLFGFTLLALLLGAAYPLLARGSELWFADFQNRWCLLLLVLVPLLFYR